MLVLRVVRMWPICGPAERKARGSFDLPHVINHDKHAAIGESRTDSLLAFALVRHFAEVDAKRLRPSCLRIGHVWVGAKAGPENTIAEVKIRMRSS